MTGTPKTVRTLSAHRVVAVSILAPASRALLLLGNRRRQGSDSGGLIGMRPWAPLRARLGGAGRAARGLTALAVALAHALPAVAARRLCRRGPLRLRARLVLPGARRPLLLL